MAIEEEARQLSPRNYPATREEAEKMLQTSAIGGYRIETILQYSERMSREANRNRRQKAR